MNNTNNATVIVGGGFVGLFTALHLAHHRYSEPVILIDKSDRFVFKPLLYEHLTGEMKNLQVFPRYEDLLEGSDVTMVRDEVTNIDLQQRRIELASGSYYDYRYLVLGVGGTQGYLGTEGAKENGFAFRTEEDTVALEKHLRSCLQQATQAELKAKKALTTVAIVGAGPSGVEMAATLGDLLPIWYEELGGDITDLRIVLVNHSNQILKGDANSHLQDTAFEALHNRTIPVELLLGAGVTKVTSDRLEYQLKDEDTTKALPAKTVVWTAGTATNPLIEKLPLKDEAKNKHGLPFVNPTLQLPQHPEVFAAGDCAIVKERDYAPLAQIAYQEAATIASNLIALSQNKELHPVDASMRGTLMKLGIRNGVANLFDKVKINGRTGDAIRNVTYLEMLPTPIHDFNATTEWLSEEIFHRYHQPQTPAEKQRKQQAKTSTAAGVTSIVVGAIAAIALIGGSIAVWRAIHPEQPATQQNSNPN